MRIAQAPSSGSSICLSPQTAACSRSSRSNPPSRWRRGLNCRERPSGLAHRRRSSSLAKRRAGLRRVASALLLALIHPSAWNRYSPKFGVLREEREAEASPSSLVETRLVWLLEEVDVFSYVALHLLGDLVLGVNGLNRALRLTRPAVYALLGVDEELIPAVIDAVDRTDLDTGLVLGAYTGLRNNIGHLFSLLPMDLSPSSYPVCIFCT